MKKAFLALLCALIGTMTIGAAVGCGTPSEKPNDTPPVSGDLGGENQGNENQGGSGKRTVGRDVVRHYVAKEGRLIARGETCIRSINGTAELIFHSNT